jgi:hypothetical protein
MGLTSASIPSVCSGSWPQHQKTETEVPFLQENHEESQPVKNRNLSRLIANLSRQNRSSERECSCVEFDFFLPGFY